MTLLFCVVKFPASVNKLPPISATDLSVCNNPNEPVEATEPLISGEFMMLPVVDRFSLPNDMSPPAAVMVKSPLDALMVLPLMFTLSI